MTDPISDMLTRIRNGQRAFLSFVNSPSSKLRLSVLESLKSEGFIKDYKTSKDDTGKVNIKIELKYYKGKPVISKLAKMSKPGRRVYSSISSMPKYSNGLGVIIVSTSKGVMTDFEARQKNLGGELICSVF